VKVHAIPAVRELPEISGDVNDDPQYFFLVRRGAVLRFGAAFLRLAALRFGAAFLRLAALRFGAAFFRTAFFAALRAGARFFAGFAAFGTRIFSGSPIA
jgi:hypothetical protein